MRARGVDRGKTHGRSPSDWGVERILDGRVVGLCYPKMKSLLKKIEGLTECRLAFYSVRSACIGFSRDARHAGARHAHPATSNRIADTDRNTMGSNGSVS